MQEHLLPASGHLGGLGQLDGGPEERQDDALLLREEGEEGEEEEERGDGQGGGVEGQQAGAEEDAGVEEVRPAHYTHLDGDNGSSG